MKMIAVTETASTTLELLVQGRIRLEPLEHAELRPGPDA